MHGALYDILLIVWKRTCASETDSVSICTWTLFIVSIFVTETSKEVAIASFAAISTCSQLSVVKPSNIIANEVFGIISQNKWIKVQIIILSDSSLIAFIDSTHNTQNYSEKVLILSTQSFLAKCCLKMPNVYACAEKTKMVNVPLEDLNQPWNSFT